jgi:hypothetical protein
MRSEAAAPGVVVERTERDLNSVLHAKITFRRPRCKGLKYLAIDMECVGDDKAAALGQR